MGWANDFNISVQQLIQHHFQAAAVVVTMDTDMDMDTLLRDRLVRTLVLNNFERGGGRVGQTASTSFNIRENKRNAEWLLMQSLKDRCSIG